MPTYLMKLRGNANGAHVVERLSLGKTTPLSEQVVERLARTELKQDVHVL